VPDGEDRCPNQGGPAFNGGCPEGIDPNNPDGNTDTDTTSPPSEPTPIPPNPTRPDPNGRCQLAPNLSVGVNVRDIPSPNGIIIDVINPGDLIDVGFAVITDAGVWYAVNGGWSSAIALVVDGDCGLDPRSITTTEVPAPERPTAGILPDSECVNLFNGEVFCFDTLTAVSPNVDDTASLIPETECVPLGNTNQMVCNTVLSAIPDNAEPASLVPQEDCFADPDGNVQCITTLVGLAPQPDDTASLVPDVACMTLPDGTPFCQNILIGEVPEDDAVAKGNIFVFTDADRNASIAPLDDRSVSVIPQCVPLPNGEQYCFDTLVTTVPDDEPVSLQPQTACVTITSGIPHCFTILVAQTPSGDDTAGLVPENTCVPIGNIGVPLCFPILSGVDGDDGDDDTASLVPQTQCTQVQGQTVCIDTLVAPSDDNQTASVPVEWVSLGDIVSPPDDPQASVTVDWVALMATVNDDSGTASNTCGDTALEQLGLDLETRTGCLASSHYGGKFTSESSNDDDTAGLVPGMQCVDVFNSDVPFCYPVLVSEIPNDYEPATASLQPEVDCVPVEGSPVLVCALGLTAQLPDADDTANVVPQTTCTQVLGDLVCIDQLVAADDNTAMMSLYLPSLDDPQTAEGRQKNRRVEMSIVFNNTADDDGVTHVRFVESLPIVTDPTEPRAAIAYPAFMRFQRRGSSSSGNTPSSGTQGAGGDVFLDFASGGSTPVPFENFDFNLAGYQFVNQAGIVYENIDFNLAGYQFGDDTEPDPNTQSAIFDIVIDQNNGTASIYLYFVGTDDLKQ